MLGLFLIIGSVVSIASDNRLVLKKLLLVAVVMFGFGFLLVPFYKKICEVTGLNATRTGEAWAQNSQVDASRWITVQFDANTNENMPWKFEPLQHSIRIHPGEMTQIMYRAVNISDHAITGQAVPSYGPALVVNYFKKIECFCFSKQTLKAHEEKIMPVQFVVQTDLPKDLHTITLSYTFFELRQTANAS